MWFGIITLATALIISISAAYYSILGLTAIFAAAFWPIVILGSSLEVGKIVSTLWLHKYWHRAELQYKIYLCSAVLILMVLTSMGVFGFLSKAHTDQSMISGDVVAKISIYDEKIKISRENIDANRKALKQMDEAVDQIMGRSTTETGADKAVAVRRGQQKERGRLLAEIEAEQKKITALNEERAPIAAEVRKVEAEVGPIKYIAALIYGDNPDTNVLEKAVRWVIILIVMVFDPLALTLLMAATKTLEWERGIKLLPPVARRPEYEQDDGPLTDDQLQQLKETAKADLPTGQVVVRESLFSDEQASVKKKTILEGLDNMWSRAKHLIVRDSEAEHAPLSVQQDESELDSVEKDARRKWKEDNPEDTIHHQEKLFATGKISRLPWHDLGLEPDNLPDGVQGEVKGFGIVFPANSKKGDMFLRVDQLPSTLYKFNGVNWIEVDKTLSDQYTYNDAYIDHLIEKINSGEYDPDLLSTAELDRIEERLKSK
jgi:cytochrome c oxidase subunit IV